MPTPTVVLLLLACASWYGTCPCPARCARSCLLACRARASSCRHLARLPLLFEFVRRCRPAVRVSRRCWLRAALCGCAEDSGVALLCASGLKNHTGTRLIHHRKPSVHQLPAALSLFARCWLNLATLLSVLKAFTAILYCTEIQYLLKYGRRSILFATATASMRAQSGPYLGVLDLTHTERHSSVLCVVWVEARICSAGMRRVKLP